MIIGLNIIHNCAVTLVDDSGHVIFASSEERFTRRKNEVGFPIKTLEHILSNYCRADQISQIVVGESCSAAFYSKEFGEFFYLSNLNQRDKIFQNKFKLAQLALKEIFSKVFKKTSHRLSELIRYKFLNLGLTAPITFLDHHLCHAASAYLASPFKESLVLTLDSEGDGCSGSVYRAEGSTLKCVERFAREESIGVFYKAIVAHLGFTPNSHEGKITGLAAFGNSTTYYLALKKWLHVEKEKFQIRVSSFFGKRSQQHLRLTDLKVFNFALNFGLRYLFGPSQDWNTFKNQIQKSVYRRLFLTDPELNHNNPESFEYRANLSAAAQKVFEDCVLEIVMSKLAHIRTDHICLAGGVFANVRLNQKIAEACPHMKVFVCPAMGDDGLSLGAALYKWSLLKKKKPAQLKTLKLGYTEKDRLNHPPQAPQMDGGQKVAEKLAKMLAQGQIIGLFRGQAEFGPRALGSRTILADPRSAEMAQLLNSRLKRNDFMPFAPVVLSEKYHLLFEENLFSSISFMIPFMTTTDVVKKDWRTKIPAVVHVDGTSRPQAISRSDDEFYYMIVNEFYKLTGVPALINTSFNIHEEPIVNSMADALRAFDHGAVDALVLNDFFLLDNLQAPEHLNQFAGNIEWPRPENSL